jgi:hypothetical protein
VSRRARHVIGCGLSALLGLQTLPARATDSRVGLELRACAALSESALREHLELELATLGLSQVEARLSLVCEPTIVTIELFRPSGESYPVQARVALGDTAKPARERLVALAATELLAQAERARENELSRLVPPAVRQERPDAPSALDRGAAQTAPERRPRIELFVAGNAALAGAPSTALWGGSLGTSWGVTHTWSVLVDTSFARGQESLRLADVRWTLFSGFVGAGANAGAGPLRLSAGFGVRAGWLSLAASSRLPNEGRSLTAPWAGVALPLRVAFDVGAFVSPFLGGEAGYVLLPVRGKVDDGSVLVEQRGPWLSGSVGVAVAL